MSFVTLDQCSQLRSLMQALVNTDDTLKGAELVVREAPARFQPAPSPIPFVFHPPIEIPQGSGVLYILDAKQKDCAKRLHQLFTKLSNLFLVKTGDSIHPMYQSIWNNNVLVITYSAASGPSCDEGINMLKKIHRTGMALLYP